jgi:hypothetical protein
MGCGFEDSKTFRKQNQILSNFIGCGAAVSYCELLKT